MRQKFFSILISILAISTLVSAETVQLSFSGVTTEGRYCLLDSVKIENLTQNWTQTLDCSIDTTYELPVAQVLPTSIDNITVSNDSRLLSVNHDFALGNTIVSINPTDNGIVRMRVIDMVGRVIIEHAEYLSAGYHQYLLQLGTPQTYMLSVVTDTEHASAKILNITFSGRYDLSRVTSLPTAYQSPRKAHATGADLMQYTGYTNQKGVAVASEPITQYQSSPEQIVFHFAPVAKGQEGMYVGILGFNSNLYPYSFDILTSSNLYAHQNFVSNLTMANGTILYHAVYTSLDNIVNAPVPEKLENVSIVTFTDGLDIGSWRMNSNYPSEALYLAAVNKQIHRTYIDGIKLDAYSIGVKGSDVTDEVRFESDLHQLASDSTNVFSVSNMDEVNARFRDIAAKIYNTKVNYSMTIKLPAPDPGSIIRFTFDDVTDANNSLYYIEGTYNYDFGASMGVLNDVTYSGIDCSNGSTWTSVPDGIFDIFTIHNIATNLGERVSTSYMRQWSYVPSTKKWQINSEFDPSSNSSSSEERTSALVMLVLDCSSSLSSDFNQMQSAANNFLSILAGKGNISKPTVSSASVKLGDLQATLSATVNNTGNLTIIGKGFCVSEYPNMDNAAFYYCEVEGAFEYLLSNLVEGKTYYVRSFAENQLGRTYGDISSFIAVTATLPEVSLISTNIIDADKILCTGQIIFDGYAPIIERGFCWSLTPNPTIDDNFIITDSNNETFEDTIKNLEVNTDIYVRAYARNKKGIGYSSETSNRYISVVSYIAEEKLPETSSSFVTGFHTNAFGASMVAHNFVDSVGTIAFDGEITKIGNYAFDECSKMTSIAIPNSIKSIGEYAFRKCSALRSFEFPDSVESIGQYAFGWCSALTSIHIPNGVKTIANNAFSVCSNVTSINIPDSLTTISWGAFASCASLTSIEIPERIESIGGCAFNGCSQLNTVIWKATRCEDFRYYDDYSDGRLPFPTSINTFIIGDNVERIPAYLCYGMKNLISIEIPNSVKSIGGYTFRSCSGLTSLTIPNSVTSIGEETFYGCTGLTSVTIGDSVTSIGKSAFYGCSGLTSLTIPNRITSIGEQTFYNCSGLTSVTIGNSVSSIGKWAFNGCTGLTSLTIPNSVTSIGESVFNGCSKLTTITLNSQSIVGKNYSSSKNISSIFSGSKVTSYIIGDSVTSIGNFAFSSHTGLTSVTIGNSVTSIGSSAFNACSSLPSVTIPESVTSIGSSAFSGCSGLTSVTIGNGVTSIGSSAFNGCTALTSIDIPNSVTTIGSSSFSGCIGLTSVTIPNGVTTIGGSAFSGCCNLTSVIIPNSVKSIGKKAFSDCTGLTSVTIDTDSIVDGSPSLESIFGTQVKEYILGNNVTSIGSFAFSGCSNLTSVTIGDNVTSIGYQAFISCTSLTSITIPNSVTSIGMNAFYNCNKVASITCKVTTPPDCGTSTFYNISTSIPVYVPAESVDAYKKAEVWKKFTNIQAIP